MKKLGERLTYANVMATIAVFIALGGTSYAISKLPKNSVGSKQLKKNAVKAAEIAKNAVGNTEIKRGAVTTDKVPDRALTGSKLAAGAVTTSNLADAAVTKSKLASDAAIKWVLVQPDGTVAAQSGGIRVTTGEFPGQYVIDFGSPTAGHAIVVSSAAATDVSYRGVVLAVPCTGGPPEASVGQKCPGIDNSPTRALVYTFASNNETPQAHAFYATLIP
jgi:hypothetical protein